MDSSRDSLRQRYTHHHGGRPYLGDRVTATVRLPRSMREQLDEEADARDITLTDLINELVARHLDRAQAVPSLADAEPEPTTGRGGFPIQEESLVA